MFQYAVLPDSTEAQVLIDTIDSIKGFSGNTGNTTRTWAQPHPHPVDGRCLVPVDWNQLRGCESHFDKIEVVSRSEARERGWHFGPFSGTFAREIEKMEDIHFLFDAVVQVYGNPNFPALRSLVLSFLSACYSLKESLKKKSQRPELKSTLGDWWTDRAEECDAKNELLHQFERYMNTEKHGGATAGQKSKISLEPTALMTTLIIREHPVQADPKTLQVSAEGAFMTAFKDTPMERRFPVGLHEARYELTVENPPGAHRDLRQHWR